MTSQASDHSPSDARSGDQLFRVDIENLGSKRSVTQPRSLVHIWKIPLPLRQQKIRSDLIKNVACVMTLLCIAQLMYIIHLKEGLIRVANDPYDNTFANIHVNSAAVWDDERQPFIHNALPVPVHSHNDYWRSIPLFEAIGSGCISVEADVHLRDSDLLVGHTGRSLRSDATLRSMYLDPLQRMLEAQNHNITDGSWRGIFNLSPQQTFVLLVDLKTSGPETFAELYAQLQPLRELDYLTYWNGSDRLIRPLTIVASGNAPFESVTEVDPQHRDIFWDAKLERLPSINDDFSSNPVKYTYNISNSYFASTEFKNARLFTWRGEFDSAPESPQLLDITASQLEQARARGLLSRYWNVPEEPPNLREIAWRVLIEREVDVLNMDDLGTVRARARGWGPINKHYTKI
ncbi:uncharacterized protein A1O9_12013 [Exophiala aquamarina CBS 119918]|uniref:Altered inheritance of mitochondria protein 6 n=1 Tax=Exophiala aquamarina CBS 119918 TaxID=1182545 RepID=A0A072NYB0_9EURO|nr:uncharacterized protein A1O9_12013 [Exophiala aquamarina CBS 119918]KEF52023.1 hypothetical protein A1O9_12013 [Exophiala aquamarina CBS 119918]